MPTMTLMPAAIQIAACIPKNGKMITAQARQAAPAPSVFTKYRVPTALPIWPERFHEVRDKDRKGGAHQQRGNQDQARLIAATATSGKSETS